MPKRSGNKRLTGVICIIICSVESSFNCLCGEIMLVKRSAMSPFTIRNVCVADEWP